MATTRPGDHAGRHRRGGEPRGRPLPGLARRQLCACRCWGAKIPVITDAYVAMEFGTGALKITPAHDFNDFEIARRHDLPAVKVIDEKGPDERGRRQVPGPGPLRLPGEDRQET